METTVARPNRLLPLRIVAFLLLAATTLGIVRAVVDRNVMLAEYPGLTQKLLATAIAVKFFSVVALAFLAFWRQRFGLWIVLACAAVELALETWAGFPLLYLLRIPVSAAVIFLAARHAWPALRRVTDVR